MTALRLFLYSYVISRPRAPHVSTHAKNTERGGGEEDDACSSSSAAHGDGSGRSRESEKAYQLAISELVSLTRRQACPSLPLTEGTATHRPLGTRCRQLPLDTEPPCPATVSPSLTYKVSELSFTLQSL